VLLALLFYGFANDVFFSRKIEKATFDSVAFRFIATNDHPDHNTIATFRKPFLPELKKLCIQILLIAREMEIEMVKLGNISLDGTKVKANVSKYKDLSWKHACKLEKQPKTEVNELMRQAEKPDRQDLTDVNIPEELARSEGRLEAIAKAKAEIERRDTERYPQQQEGFEKKVADREAKEQKTGMKISGKKPKLPDPGPEDTEQINLTDEESRIMPTSEGGFGQCYNVQASLDMDSMLIITPHVT
jgi:hypothetical protein